MTTKTTEIPKDFPKFICEKCNIKTNNKKDYTNHLLTLKHAKIHEITTNTTKNSQNSPNLNIKKCDCGKEYKDRAGLWRHKQKCNHNKIIENTNVKNDDNSIILELVKQNQSLIMNNQEFKELIIEQNKYMLEQNQKIMELSKNINITNNTNCHNKTKFNLNFFLNEQCKDALNLTDFVNDLQIQLTDLENVGRLGYTEGISKIFIDGLKQLDVSKRPIHCSDFKREVLYIKDQDAWEKENEENKKIKKAIHHISHKNIQQIQKWTDNHPNCKESDSKQNDQYMQILCESMGSAEPANLEKVIRNIAKEVVIDK